MEESQNKILQLLQETQQPALEPYKEILFPREPPLAEDVRSEHLHVEIPLPVPRILMGATSAMILHVITTTVPRQHYVSHDPACNNHVNATSGTILRPISKRDILIIESRIWTRQIQRALDHKILISLIPSECLMNAVHPNHSPFTLDLPPIYKPCHSRKSINRPLLPLGKWPLSLRKQERDRRSLLPHRPPLRVPLDHRLMPEFHRTTA
ncbi:hypothetical protein M5K25_024685 [Dendrobium thyrsiflorum]|uniref:Uncharacterized protein n=1 Tax=Dendrobium thyrsiflorum TaxID=117978 RepID=A0ABD0U2W0_DENTH